jgi:hypothetical protein
MLKLSGQKDHKFIQVHVAGFTWAQSVMLKLNQSLSNQLQEAFPLAEYEDFARVPALLTSIVKSRFAKPFDIGEIHQSDLAGFKFVFLKAVSIFFHIKLLKASPRLTTISCMLFGVHNKIQHGTDSNNNTAGSGHDRAFSDDACKSSTTSKQAGKREYVSHSAKQPLLKLHVSNYVAGALNSFPKRHWIKPFRKTGESSIFHAINPLSGAYADFVFWKIWIIRKTRFWSWNPDRWNTWDLARWMPFSCSVSLLKFHRFSPLQNVNEEEIISSLGLVLKKRLFFLPEARHD